MRPLAIKPLTYCRNYSTVILPNNKSSVSKLLPQEKALQNLNAYCHYCKVNMSKVLPSEGPTCAHCAMPDGNSNRPIMMDAFERRRIRDAMDTDIIYHHSDDDGSSGVADKQQIVTPESPFLALRYLLIHLSYPTGQMTHFFGHQIRSLLRMLQLLGVFNFSFDDDCSVFRCRAHWYGLIFLLYKCV